MAAQLIEALKEAEDLEQLESNWAVKQNVEETIKFLHQVTQLKKLLIKTSSKNNHSSGLIKRTAFVKVVLK